MAESALRKSASLAFPLCSLRLYCKALACIQVECLGPVYWLAKAAIRNWSTHRLIGSFRIRLHLSFSTLDSPRVETISLAKVCPSIEKVAAFIENCMRECFLAVSLTPRTASKSDWVV